MLSGIGKLVRPALKARYGARLEQMYIDIAEGQANELRALRRCEVATGRCWRRSRGRWWPRWGSRPMICTRAHEFVELGGDSLSALSFSTLLNEIFEVEVPGRRHHRPEQRPRVPGGLH